MQSGEKVVLKSGSLADAMRASMAVPGVFTPHEINGRLLVDGGLSSNLPIETVRAMGADIVIAVDVQPKLLKSPEELAIGFRLQNALGGIDAGLRFGQFGELRLGYSRGFGHIGRTLNLPPDLTGWSDRGEARAALTLDTLDRAIFPTSGFLAPPPRRYRAKSSARARITAGSTRSSTSRSRLEKTPSSRALSRS